MTDKFKHKNEKYNVELDFDVNELSDNRYRNRRFVREAINSIQKNSFEKSRAAGWDPYIRVDLHVVDRLTDREFPVDEFFQIVAKFVTRHEDELLEFVDRRYNRDENDPIRINVYGHGAWMIGVSISLHINKYTNSKSFHVNVRTCYSERNAVFRERAVGVEKVWTRGMPAWMKKRTESTNTNKES